MGSGFEHLPLAVFTTLVPMAAASFIVLAYAFIAGRPDAEATRRLDRWTALPAAVMACGMAAAFLHLASPLNAFGVFAGIGASPLSNELAVTVAFALVALVYWLLALAGRLPAEGAARKALLVVLACWSVAVAVFCGLAYVMPTIPTWGSPYTVAQMVGFALVGGAALGAAVCALAKAPLPASAPLVEAGLGALGAVVALAGLGLQAAGLDAIANIWGAASALVPSLGLMIGAFGLCAVAAVVLVWRGARPAGRGASAAGAVALVPAAALTATALAAVGIFVARIAFYGLYMGMAL